MRIISWNCWGLGNFLCSLFLPKKCPRGKTISILISYGNQSNNKGKGNTMLTRGLVLTSGLRSNKKNVINVATSTKLCYNLSFVYGQQCLHERQEI